MCLNELDQSVSVRLVVMCVSMSDQSVLDCALCVLLGVDLFQ